MKAIEVINLTKDYGGSPALHGVSFDVEQGEFFGLLGPNGAGKSTILNILAGLTRPSSGTARVLGSDVQREFRSARRNLGVVPQELSFESFFTIYKVLVTQAGYFGISDNSAWLEEVLKRLHLWEHRNKHGRQLSGGMKRRLLVAKALVHRPPVVILDEPTAGVDVSLRRELWSFIKEIHAAGTTILLTTHYLQEAEALCNRIGILGDGKLLALETIADLLSKHSDREVRLTVHPALTEIPEALKAFSATLEGSGTCLLLKTKGSESRSRLWTVLCRSGLDIQDVQVHQPDLEEVFLEITGQ